MTIRCPYCAKRFHGVKAVYGHWPHCKDYADFVAKYGKEARLPFKWSGYPNRLPKDWVDKRKATQKPVGKPIEQKKEVKKS